MKLPLALYSFAAGAAWGGLGYLLGADAVGPAIWPGVVASPLIGLVVGLGIHPRFAGSTGGARWLWALASLYLGAVLFGLVIGVADELAMAGSGRMPGAAIAETVVGVLWGVTITGFVLVLGPLAYLTHWLLEWRLE